MVDGMDTKQLLEKLKKEKARELVRLAKTVRQSQQEGKLTKA